MADPESQDQTPLISRRKALFGAAAGIGAIGLARVVGREKKAHALAEQTTPSGVTIYIDQEGLPVSALLPDAKTVKFDVLQMRKLKEKAMQTKESEIIEVFRLPASSFPSEDSYTNRDTLAFRQTQPEKHPKTDTLPKDVISEKELEARGVKVVQANNTQLYLREGIFAPGEPLAIYKKGDRRRLSIVLLDTPYISPESVQDLKYHDVAWVLSRPEHEEGRMGGVAQIREKELQMNEQGLKSLRDNSSTELTSTSDNITELNARDYNILNYKRYASVLKQLTDQELLLLMDRRIQGLSDRGGLHFFNDNEAFVFLSVADDYKNALFSTFSFTPAGEFQTEDTGLFGKPYSLGPRLEPDESQTYPNPADFKLDKTASPNVPRAYPYGFQTLGQALRHEIAHNELDFQSQPPAFNEYNTDMKAMSHIADAWKRWNTSGDNSGFYIALAKPNGGFVLS